MAVAGDPRVAGLTAPACQSHDSGKARRDVCSVADPGGTAGDFHPYTDQVGLHRHVAYVAAVDGAAGDGDVDDDAAAAAAAASHHADSSVHAQVLVYPQTEDGPRAHASLLDGDEAVDRQQEHDDGGGGGGGLVVGAPELGHSALAELHPVPSAQCCVLLLLRLVEQLTPVVLLVVGDPSWSPEAACLGEEAAAEVREPCVEVQADRADLALQLVVQGGLALPAWAAAAWAEPACWTVR